MKLLKDRILRDGKALSADILKVDNFINHCIDADLMAEIAREFSRRFKDKNVNKIVTIESSGIAPAVMLGHLMHLPVVFVKKRVPSTMSDAFCTTIHSFTKNKDYQASVAKEFLGENDRILFIDDFLAHGNAADGIIDLCRKSGAKLEGMGFIIEKGFQQGGDKLRAKGYDVVSLAIIDEMAPGKISFR